MRVVPGLRLRLRIETLPGTLLRHGREVRECHAALRAVAPEPISELSWAFGRVLGFGVSTDTTFPARLLPAHDSLAVRRHEARIAL
jgi:hypothetical protein